MSKPQIVTLPKGANVIEALTSWCGNQGITAASIQAIGAVENAEICFYELPGKNYQCTSLVETHEVLSATGNVTIKDGAPFIHMHVILGDKECNTRGGHLKEAVVAVTLECMITPLSGEYARSHDETIGLYLLPATEL